MPAKALDVLIIGAGFGGVAMAIRLKKAGLTHFTVLERAPDLGGVWWSNSYPGAACDVESRLYSFSFAQDFEWTKSHGDRDEIRAYFQHCVGKFGIGSRPARRWRFRRGVLPFVQLES